MKKILIFLIILVPMFLFAQEVDETNQVEDTNETEFNMGGSAGSMTINGEMYTRIRLNPELSFWRFGLGLDFDLLINSDGEVRKEDWDDFEDYLNKILYIRYQERGDNFYFKVGAIKSYTLGHGLIMNNYSNMLLYPDPRKTGGYMGFNTPFSGAGAEVFTSDFNRNDVLAGRVKVNPLGTLNLGLLSNLEVGLSCGYDKNAYEKYRNYVFDYDNDGIPDSEDHDVNNNNLIDNEEFPGYDENNSEFFEENPIINAYDMSKKEEVIILGLDYTVPILTTDFITLEHYAEAAKIIDYGEGFIFPGFHSRFLMFDMKLEGRRFEDQFLPGFFDGSYDNERSQLYEIETDNDKVVRTIVTKESLLENIDASTGWYASITSNIADLLYLDIAFQDMYGDGLVYGKSLWAGLRADTSMIPKIREASITYSQTNKKYIDFHRFRAIGAQVNGKISYELGGSSYLVGKYQERYNDVDGDGKIKGDKEISKTFGFGVEFYF